MTSNNPDDITDIKVSIAKVEENQRLNVIKLDLLITKLENVPTSKDIERIEKRIDKNEEKTAENEKEIEGIHDMANKWKGGVLVIMVVGSVLGWLGSAASTIAKFFHIGNTGGV